MTSLTYLRLDSVTLGTMHPLWLQYSKLDISKAYVRSKLLIQRYPLSGSHTSGAAKSSSCTLCKEDKETVTHFLLHCPSLQYARNLYLPRILNITRRLEISIDPEIITAIILDSHHLPKYCSKVDYSELDKLCRDMIFKLHRRSTQPESN